VTRRSDSETAARCSNGGCRDDAQTARLQTVAAARTASNPHCRGGHARRRAVGGVRTVQSGRRPLRRRHGRVAPLPWRVVPCGDEALTRGPRCGKEEADRWDPTGDNSLIKNNSE
jgi:hypothetical protein